MATIPPSPMPFRPKQQGTPSMPTEVAARLDTHEAVCAERYGGINSRLGRIEKILMAFCGGMFSFGAAIILLLIQLWGHK